MCDPCVDLVTHDSETNPLIGSQVNDFAKDHDTYRVPNDSHDFLLEESASRAVFDFTYEINNEVGEDSEDEEIHEDDEDTINEEEV